jgi:acyl-CoA thioesterase I
MLERAPLDLHAVAFLALAIGACGTSPPTQPASSSGAETGGTSNGGTSASGGNVTGGSGGSEALPSAGGSAGVGGNGGDPSDDEAYWGPGTMTDDFMLFVSAGDGELATADLLFVPDGDVTLVSADGAVSYQEGVDFSRADGARTLTLTSASTIPFKTDAELHPSPGAPMSISGSTNGTTALFFGEGTLFHSLQVRASYSHADAWTGASPAAKSEHLPNTLAKLSAAEAVNIVVLGDSISTGANASEFTGVAPFVPPYANQVAERLSDAYSTTVSLKNLSVGGTGADWGATQVGNVTAESPDLVIIAFGMNDTWVPIDTWKGNIQSIVSGVQAATPNAEFVLVAGMAGNPEWNGLNSAFFTEGRDALASLTGPGVALADVTSVWLDVMQTKKFLDLTGNGVNHPNDFGHRVYTDVICGLLLP